MEAWIIWLVAAVAAALGEIATGGAFFLAPFALGAGIATIAAGLGLPTLIVWLLFALVTTLSFLALRPIARRHRNMPARIRTGMAALVGETVIVVQTIDNSQDSGQISLSGEIWTARSLNYDETIAVGMHASIVEIRGATAVVVPNP